MSEGWRGSADFELSSNRFRLQNYYVEDWANNCMVAIAVDDISAWHERVKAIQGSSEFSGVRVKQPEKIDGATVLHVWDLSGVLLVFSSTGASHADQHLRVQIFAVRSRSELAITETELKLIAAAAMVGLRTKPKTG